MDKYQDRLVYGTDNRPAISKYRVTVRILETTDEHLYEIDLLGYHRPLFGLALVSTSLLGQELFLRARLTLETRTTTKELDPKTKEMLYLSKALIRPSWPSMLYIYEPNKEYYVIRIENVARREFESTQSTKRIEWKGIGTEVSPKKEYLVSMMSKIKNISDF